MRALAVDLGKVRVGLAKSDELGLFAHPIGFIDRGGDNDEFISNLGPYFDDVRPEVVVIGYPVKLSGDEGDAASDAKNISEVIKEVFVVNVVLWDERMSTKEASFFVRGAKRKKKKRVIDSIAAQIILQSYLDSKRR